MNAPPPAPPSSSTSWARDLGWIVLTCALVFGLRLGSHPLANPDEARYAEIPREMLATGDWVTPRLNAVNYFEKPPLVYWAEAVSLGVFGLNEWAARLVPAAFAFAGVLLTYGAARRLNGPAAALPAAIVLATSLLYVALARTLLLDGAVTVLMSATLFCFILGVREPADPRGAQSRVAGGGDPSPASSRLATRLAGFSRRRWYFYGLYASAALAVLTKGLIGVLLSGLVMFTWLLVFNQWRRLRPLYLPTGLLLFFAMAVPWHLLVAQANPDWAHFYFVREHWERFTTTAHGRFEPWWYFLPVVALGFFPWIGFLIPALPAALRGGWAARKQNADGWFLITWAVVVFLFFSKSQSKLIPYILPVFPPLAVLVGAYLGRTGGSGGAQRLRDGFGVFAGVSGLLGVAVAITVLKPGIIRDPVQAAALQPIGLVLGGWLLTGAGAVVWLLKRRGGGPALLGTLLTTIGLYVGLAFAQVHIARPSTKELAAIVSAQAAAGDRVLHYRDFFHDFTFYARREVGVVGYYGELEVKEDPRAQASGRFIDELEFRRQWTQPGRIWLVARKRAVGELFGDATFRYHLIAETRGHYLISNQP